MSPTDVAVPHTADEVESPATDERPDRTEPVDRVKKDSADTEKKTGDGRNKRPVGLIDLMR